MHIDTRFLPSCQVPDMHLALCRMHYLGKTARTSEGASTFQFDPSTPVYCRATETSWCSAGLFVCLFWFMNSRRP